MKSCSKDIQCVMLKYWNTNKKTKSVCNDKVSIGLDMLACNECEQILYYMWGCPSKNKDKKMSHATKKEWACTANPIVKMVFVSLRVRKSETQSSVVHIIKPAPQIVRRSYLGHALSHIDKAAPRDDVLRTRITPQAQTMFSCSNRGSDRGWETMTCEGCSVIRAASTTSSISPGSNVGSDRGWGWGWGWGWVMISGECSAAWVMSSHNKK